MSTNLQKSLARRPISAARAYAVIQEQEADGRGGFADVLTIFLTASECPIGCSMCDLWRNTLEFATPQGAIADQIAAVLTQRTPTATKPQWIKLYNSGNFFDPRSIPEFDYPAIAASCKSFARVVVENHPRFGAERLRRFRELLDVPLEVAVGLETVQPRWLSRLGKQMSRDDFDRYARCLKEQEVDLRVFLIVGVPSVSVTEAMRWARLSVRHACRAGARHISLIPARPGHGWGDLAAQLPALRPRHLADLQRIVLNEIAGAAVVTVDTWDLQTAVASVQDRQSLSSIQRMNLSQRAA